MSPSVPSITILVPTFNRAKYLAECLDSLLAQTFPATQVIVVNDGSTDDTQAVLAPYRGRIDYLETPQLGKPGSLNKAIERVRGEYLWIFDDDDVALPDALARLVEPLEASREYDFSYSSYFFTPSAPNTNRIGTPAYEYTLPDVQTRGPLLPLLEANYLGGAALFARTSCYGVVGNFDAALLRSQDYEMAFRFVKKFRGTAIRDATFHYRQHEDVRGNSRDRFDSKTKLVKWLEYDQKFFRKFYLEWPLEDYTPPGTAPDRVERLGLLQRFALMCNKLLTIEALRDLEALAALDDSRPFTHPEKEVVRALIKGSWYFRMMNVLEQPEILGALREHAPKSRFIAALRAEIVGAVIVLNLRHPHPKRILNGLRCSGLYW